MTRLFLLLVAFLLIVPNVEAQSRRELAARLDAVEARLAEMEEQRLRQNDQYLTRISELEFQLQNVTGIAERLEFDNRQLRQNAERQADDLERLERQIQGLRQGLVTPGPEDEALEVPSGEQASNPAGPRNLTGRNIAVTDEGDPYANERANATRALGGGQNLAEPTQPAISANQAYGRARARLLDGDFDAAQEDFLFFIDEFPEDELVDEAWFWLGETHFVRGDYNASAEAYITSLRTDRQGAMAPDALVRLASSLGALGRNDEACQTLARFGREFPTANPSALARAEREALRAGCN